jgi:hypothetical protein
MKSSISAWGILAFIGIAGWLPLAYYNVYKQDGYLTPFTTCRVTNNDVCVPQRKRNMFISRALRAIRCPLLGWKDAPCAKERRGVATWWLTILFLVAGTWGSIGVFSGMDHMEKKGVPIFLSVAVAVLLFGLLEVPYGNDKKNHESKSRHLGMAITAFALMIINSLYLASNSVGRTQKTLRVLTGFLFVTALMAGTSEAVVDNNIPGVTRKAHAWYSKKQWHTRLIDSLFELGENFPVILYSAIILVASEKKV